MSDYIDETSLTDEEVAAAIAEAKAKKAEKAAKKAQGKAKLEKAKSLDEESSDALLNESSSAAQLEEEEDESPAVRSAKSFSNAFAAAKKKRELDLLKKKEEREAQAEEDDDDEDEPQDAAAVIADDEDFEDAEFDTDDEDEDIGSGESGIEEDSDEEFDDEDDEEDEEDDEDADEDYDGDGIFETDDENGEYNTTVNVDENDGEEDEDEDEDEEDEDDSTFSTKTKVIIGIIIAILVIAIICAAAFFMKGKGSSDDTSSTVSDSSGDVTSVKFAEASISLEVGETKDLKLVVEPEDATDKTFKLKSNDETIAKVNAQGQITGISSGSTTVTATLKSNPTMTASLVVNVIDEEQSALNIYNKFLNSVLDGSTDIDSESDEDTDSETDEEAAEGEEAETDSDSDSDSETEKRAKAPTHTLTGNKIEDLNSDGDMELALYYEPNTDNEEPLIRIFHLVDPDAAPEETPEEEEPQYDEYGNLIEPETDSEAETDTSKSESDTKKKSPSEMTLEEVDPVTELYAVCREALESEEPWNTSYLEVKESEQTTARVKILSDGYAAPTYTFTSEDEEIATVDKQGNIKGVKPGTVFITVGSPLNSDAVAKIKVRVKDDTDLLDDYLADIPVVNNTNDNIFPTETLTGKAIVDIDNDGVSELLLRFRYSDNVETINLIKVENEKCVCYKTYNNLSDLYEYNEGSGSYSNSILVHYTTGVVRMEYKAVVSKDGSKSRTSEEKILTLESGGSLSELVSFRATTDISTKTVTSEVTVNDASSEEEDSETIDDETSAVESETTYENDDTDEETGSESGETYVDEDEDGYDDITGAIIGSYAEFTFDEIAENGIDLTNKKPVKKLPQTAGAPEDEDEDDYYDEDYDEDYDDGDDGDEDTTSENEDDGDDEETTSTVETEVSEETTKYYVNGTPVDKSVYEETLTSYSATYSVWNAWENVY